MELHSTEEEDATGFNQWGAFTIGVGTFSEVVNEKKATDCCRPYPSVTTRAKGFRLEVQRLVD